MVFEFSPVTWRGGAVAMAAPTMRVIGQLAGQIVSLGQPRKASFILVREALSSPRPHDRVIKQEISRLKLPGMQARPQHPKRENPDLSFCLSES